MLLTFAWVSTAQAVQATQVRGAVPALAPAATTTQQVSAMEGSPVTVTIAVGQTCPSAVTIDWGDNTTSAGLVCDSSGSVTDSHTYAEEGNDTITVLDPTITNPPSPLQTAAVQVGDAALTGTGLTAATAVTGQPVTTPAATFSDANPAATIADYTASISWGDGQTTNGSIIGSPGSDLTVSDAGNHTYATSGPYTVDVTITDVGGSQLDVSYPMTVSDPGSSTTSSTSTTDAGSSTSTGTTTTGTTATSTATNTSSMSSSPATSTASMTTASTWSPTSYQATLYGTVVLVRPHLPGSSPAQAVDPGARVTVVMATRQGTVRRTTLTGKTGVYSFANLPPCSPAAGDTCTVSVTSPDGSAIADQSSVTLADRPGSTRVDLVAGRLSSRFFIAGSVLAPGAVTGVDDPAIGPARPPSDLTVWVERGNSLEEIYDGLRACRTGRWAGVPSGLRPRPCTSTAGSYLLGQVALPGTKGVLASVGPTPTRVVLILLEANRPGGTYVPVDSTLLNLPANSAANNANPPLTIASPLHEVFPFPPFGGGHSISGRVIRVRSHVPGAKASTPIGVHDATVVLTIGSGKHVMKRQARTTRFGYYTFFAIPACPRRGNCNVALVGRRHKVLATRRIHVPNLNPSVTVIDLKAPPTTTR